MERIPRSLLLGVLAVTLATTAAAAGAETGAAGRSVTRASDPGTAAVVLHAVKSGLASRSGPVHLALTTPRGDSEPVRVVVRSRPLSHVARVTLAVNGERLASFVPRRARFHGARGSIGRGRLAGGVHRVVVRIARRGAPDLFIRRTVSLPGAGGDPVRIPGTVRAPAPTPTTDLDPAPATESGPHPAPPPSAPRRILWGAWVDGDAYGPSRDDPPWDMTSLETFEGHAGKAASILHYGQFWRVGGVAQPFYAGDHQRVRDHGAIPMLDWNPWDSFAGGSVTQPDFALGRIIAGDHDAYITSWATGARNWGHPLFLRFAHEMNGDWFPWSERVNGNAAGQYVAAWRHVHDLFASVGATNVTWVWSPNAIYPGSIPLDGLYPGDAYVDWVAIDGYNWGTNPSRPDVWRSFTQVFAPTYDALGVLAPSRPVMLAEFGTTEHGGSKAAWIAEAFAQIPTRFPRIRAAVWFNWDTDGDWSIESSASAQAAFATGIASSAFTGADFAATPGGVIGPPEV